MGLRRLLLLVNFAKEGAASLVERIEGWGEERGVEIEVHGGLEEGLEAAPVEGEGTVLLTIGGDGTFLRGALRLAPKGVPILGVNLGSLGFLTQTRGGEILQVLERLRRGEFAVEERMMLEGRFHDERFLALNDLVLSRRTLDGFTELELYADGEFVARYPGDGLIIATPTGSTAYSLAAGGPIIDPRLELLIATPLAPHLLGLRSIVFPPEASLQVVAREPTLLLADGDEEGELAPGDRLSITCSDHRVRMVVASPRPGFFSLLERKLNWGRDSNRDRG